MSVAARIFVGRYAFLPSRPLDWFPLCRVFEFGLGAYLVVAAPSLFATRTVHSNRKRAFVAYLSELSFPVFLFHYPVPYVINLLTSRGVSDALSILCFLAIACVGSWLLLMADRWVQKRIR